MRKRGDSRSHSELLFSVRDTGVGISSEAQARLFKPFAQADASTTRIHGGTGLGLVICKRIVDLMGGQIGVKSEAGKGSTFWFSVPLLKAVGDMQPARSDLHGSRALVVTTDQALLRRISGWLTTWGVQFAQTSVSAEALAKLRASAGMGEAWSYDFLVLDWGAMKNSALSLARNVMREGSLERVRILAIGGDEDVPSEVRGATRMLALGRQVGDVELRSAMQRLLDQEAGEPAPAAVESLLPPSLPTDSRGGAPAATAATAVSTPGPTAAVATGGVGGHVLLVEDNPVNRQVAQRLLALVGVSHDVAENGKQALDCLAQSRYDAVLMDCQMPIMDGYTATRSLRRLEADGQRKGHVPVIAMTANAMAGDREKCLGAGMDDYMSKPLNRALLEQTLRKWIAPGAPTRAGATTSTPAATAPAPRPLVAPAGAATPAAPALRPATAPAAPRSLRAARRRDDRRTRHRGPGPACAGGLRRQRQPRRADRRGRDPGPARGDGRRIHRPGAGVPRGRAQERVPARARRDVGRRSTGWSRRPTRSSPPAPTWARSASPRWPSASSTAPAAAACPAKPCCWSPNWATSTSASPPSSAACSAGPPEALSERYSRDQADRAQSALLQSGPCRSALCARSAWSRPSKPLLQRRGSRRSAAALRTRSWSAGRASRPGGRPGRAGSRASRCAPPPTRGCARTTRG